MITEQSTKVRKEFSETLNQVAYKGERVILERYGKKIAALIPIEDYELLEALEDRLDITDAEEILEMTSKEDIVSWAKAKKELHK